MNRVKKCNYYPFAVKLGRCVESCNTVNKVCVPNKTQDLNLRVCNIVTEMNESKTLIKHISCESKCRWFDERKCNSGQWWNNDKRWCEYESIIYVKKVVFGIVLHVIVKTENI